jgi:mannose-6-phosphate isomerase-like protein (cupin superfamily)
MWKKVSPVVVTRWAVLAATILAAPVPAGAGERIEVTNLDSLLRRKPLQPDALAEIIAARPAGNGQLQVVIMRRIDLHVHDDADHVLYLARGSGIANLDGERREITVGDIISVPRGVGHGFEKKPDSEDLVFLVVQTPG